MSSSDEEDGVRAGGVDAATKNKLKKERKRRAKERKVAEESGGARPVSGTAADKTASKKRINLDASVAVETAEREPDAEGLEFEDPHEDVWDDEEEIVSGGDDDDDDAAGDAAAQADAEDDEEDLPRTGKTVMFVPNATDEDGNPLTIEEEEMEHDLSAYAVLHRMQFETPALSFDFLCDQMGSERWKFPQTLWLVQGSSSGGSTGLNVMRAASLHKTRRSEEDEEDALMGAIDLNGNDDDEALLEDRDPTLEHRSFAHVGGVNRVRSMPQRSSVVATWSDNGDVNLYDCSKALKSLHMQSVESTVSSQHGVFYTFKGHKGEEGYALDFSPLRAGRMASGDCSGRIFIWDADWSSNKISIDPKPYTNGTSQESVEDLQWSPTEESVLASCSTDGYIRIWDSRASNKSKAMLSVKAHDQDVNVITWSQRVTNLLASGSDDCSFKVWDLRQFKADSPAGLFSNFHTGPITSIQWSPHDESVIACASEDDQVSIWDLALEEDQEYAASANMAQEVIDAQGRRVNLPSQLLFVHGGLKEPKEVRFHPHIVGLIGATGSQGFDLFVCEPLERQTNQMELA